MGCDSDVLLNVFRVLHLIISEYLLRSIHLVSTRRRKFQAIGSAQVVPGSLVYCRYDLMERCMFQFIIRRLSRVSY